MGSAMDHPETYGIDKPPSVRCPIEGCVERKDRFTLMCVEHEAEIPGDLLGAFEIAWRTVKVGSYGEWQAFVDHRAECIRYVNQLEADRRVALVAGDGGLSGEQGPSL